MAFSGTEYFQPGDISYVMAGSSTHAVGLLYPGSSLQSRIGVFTVATNTALVYGLPWSSGYNIPSGSMVYAASAFWLQYNSGSAPFLIRIDPSSWSVASVGSGGNPGAVTVCGDWIYGRQFKYNTTTDTLSTHSNAQQHWGSVAGRLFAISSVTLSEVDPSTDSVIDTWALPYTGYGRGVAIGNRLFFRTQIANSPFVWFDASTDTVGLRTASPATTWFSTYQCTAHTDGYIYSVLDIGGGKRLQVLDPATGRWFADYPVTNRDRGGVTSAGGKILLTSGDPSSWP